MMNTVDGPRPARPEELPQIIDLANAVMRVGRAPTIATDYSFIYKPENVGNVMVVKDGDRVVSMTGIWVNRAEAGGASIPSGGINCVATLPGYRGRGLASQTMQAAMSHMSKLGCHVGRLTTNIKDWYYRLGWENTGSLCTYTLNHSNIDLMPALAAGVRVESPADFDDKTVNAIVELRQADRLGGDRTTAVMRELLAAGNDPSLVGNKRPVLARQNGAIVAYCIDSDFGIVEWGGPDPLVAGTIREWFTSRAGERANQRSRNAEDRVAASPELAIVAPLTGHAFATRLASLGLPCRRDYWGMLYVVDPRGILDTFGLDDISVNEQDGNFTLTRGDASISVDRQGLAKLLFGPERTSDFAADVLPLLYWQWPLEHV